EKEPPRLGQLRARRVLLGVVASSAPAALTSDLPPSARLASPNALTSLGRTRLTSAPRAKPNATTSSQNEKKLPLGPPRAAGASRGRTLGRARPRREDGRGKTVDGRR